MIPDPTSLGARVEIVCVYIVGLCALFAVLAALEAVLTPLVRRLSRWGDGRW